MEFSSFVNQEIFKISYYRKSRQFIALYNKIKHFVRVAIPEIVGEIYNNNI